MKLLKKLMAGIFGFTLIIVIIILIGFIGIKFIYGIDLYKTSKELKVLTEEVNEEELCPNAYDNSDFDRLENLLNGKMNGFVKKEEGKGYKGFYFDFNNLNPLSPIGTINLSEREVGALAQTMFYEQTDGKIVLANKEITTTIMQIDFQNIDRKGNADFNVVVKLELLPIKEEMTTFPFNLFKKYIPDYMYVSSIVRINKDGTDFAYSLVNQSFTINNLSKKETEDLFHTLNVFLKFGEAEYFNMLIGQTAVDALIGNEENEGFAYSLRVIGKHSFAFKTIDDEDYFTIY